MQLTFPDRTSFDFIAAQSELALLIVDYEHLHLVQCALQKTPKVSEGSSAARETSVAADNSGHGLQGLEYPRQCAASSEPLHPFYPASLSGADLDTPNGYLC
jgi:hypothetical protein